MDKPLLVLSLKKLEEHNSKWAGYTIHERGNKVILEKVEPRMNEAGFIVGDSVYQLFGTKVNGDVVVFNKDRVLVGDLPRSMRAVVREYYASQSPVEILGLTSLVDSNANKKMNYPKSTTYV